MKATIDYRDILEKELSRRIVSNPSYSLRSFARDLGFSPAQISKILNSKQGLSAKKAKDVVDRLPLSSLEKKVFLLSVDLKHSRDELVKEKAYKELGLYERDLKKKVLEENQLITLGSWHYNAVQEVLLLNSDKKDITWISEKLKMDVKETEVVLRTLEKLNLIQEDNGHYEVVYEDSGTTYDIPSEVIRNYHKMIMKKASEEIELQKVESREYTSTMFAVDENDIASMKKEIRELKDKYIKKYSNKENKSALYCFNMQLFRVDQ